MARVQISLPDKFIFSTDISVRIDDVNGLHLGYESFFTYLSEARARFLRSLGYPDQGDIEGVSNIVADVSIVYMKQGYYGQTLKVEIGATDFSSKGFDMVYRISNAETGVEMVRAKTGLLFFDYKNQKVATIPPVLKKKLSN
jgi:acyl-CoA thioester hydrolase